MSQKGKKKVFSIPVDAKEIDRKFYTNHNVNVVKNPPFKSEFLFLPYELDVTGIYLSWKDLSRMNLACFFPTKKYNIVQVAKELGSFSQNITLPPWTLFVYDNNWNEVLSLNGQFRMNRWGRISPIIVVVDDKFLVWWSADCFGENQDDNINFIDLARGVEWIVTLATVLSLAKNMSMNSVLCHSYRIHSLLPWKKYLVVIGVFADIPCVFLVDCEMMTCEFLWQPELNGSQTTAHIHNFDISGNHLIIQIGRFIQKSVYSFDLETRESVSSSIGIDLEYDSRVRRYTSSNTSTNDQLLDYATLKSIPLPESSFESMECGRFLDGTWELSFPGVLPSRLFLECIIRKKRICFETEVSNVAVYKYGDETGDEMTHYDKILCQLGDKIDPVTGNIMLLPQGCFIYQIRENFRLGIILRSNYDTAFQFL